MLDETPTMISLKDATPGTEFYLLRGVNNRPAGLCVYRQAVNGCIAITAGTTDEVQFVPFREAEKAPITFDFDHYWKLVGAGR